MSSDLLPEYWNSATERHGTRCETVTLYVQVCGVRSSPMFRTLIEEPSPATPNEGEYWGYELKPMQHAGRPDFCTVLSSRMPSGWVKPELALLEEIWYRNRPAPPRRTVLPFPNRSYAKPKRGSTKNGFEGKPDTGMLGSMPFQPSPSARRGSVVVSGLIPNGNAGTAGRKPVAHMLEAETAGEREPASGLPLVVHEERVLVVLEVRHRLSLLLGDAVIAARDPVGHGVAGAGRAPRIDFDAALARIVQTAAGLVIAGIVPVDAGFQSMAADDLGNVVADIGRLR